MGIEAPFRPVKFFSGVIYGDRELYRQAREQLEQRYSPVDLESPEFLFTMTDYYDAEMGRPLYRRFMAFRDLAAPEGLPEMKLWTNGVELENARDGKRRLNLDPGYLSDANVIIATTKNYYQRVPLTRGIYAHMEYVIKKKRPAILEWTYPDFRTQEYMDFFLHLLHRYKEQSKPGAVPPAS